MEAITPVSPSRKESFAAPRLKPRNHLDEDYRFESKSMVNELREATDEEFNAFITGLMDDPQSYLREIFWGTMYMPGFPFTECVCENGNAHNRFEEGNTRVKVEQFIVEHAKPISNSKTEIAILSVGSGKLLQELLLLIQLANQGFRKIQLVMLDPEYIDPSSSYTDAQEALRLIADRMSKSKHAPIEIELQFHGKFDDLNTNDAFDVVYAVDYDDMDICQDYSSRKLSGRSAETTGTSYHAAIDFIKSPVLLKPDTTSFAALSKGKNIITCNTSQPCINADNATITELLDRYEQPPTFDTVYLYSNIATLIYNLDFLVANKENTLLINTALVNDEDKPWIDALLKKYGIPYPFLSEKDAVKYMKDQEPNHKILIVDYSLYDSAKKEEVLPKEFLLDDKHVSIIRTDFKTMKNPQPAGGTRSGATFIHTKFAESACVIL